MLKFLSGIDLISLGKRMTDFFAFQSVVKCVPSLVLFTFLPVVIGKLCFVMVASLEPAHDDKTYNKTCVTRKDSQQPVHPPSMARVLVYPSLIDWRLLKLHAISEDSDQTARMRRLI